MATSYLSCQLSSVIEQLHSLFEEIGIPSHERESRESELLTTISKTLNNHVRQVTNEKHNLIEEAKHIVKTIRQMEASLQDRKPLGEHDEVNFKISYPLILCLKELKKKHLHISKLHKERFEEVKKIVQSLESFSSHLEPSFVKITLPPTSPSASIPPTFDLSPNYVISLEKELDRVHKEYMQRTSTVKSLSEGIILLWAELGTPQAQTDRKIVEHYKDSPEQLGLHEANISQLRLKREKLIDEKRRREKQLQDLRELVEFLWNKLGIEDLHRNNFLNSNRGCGIRQINKFEYELARLNELKRQNLDLFVEDARYKLQELWDTLYFSEEEMLDFTPAFSDVYTDALLEAHEQEISRLEALRQQRAPILALLEKHRALVKDRDDLQASSQDVSRLLVRGQKGEKRDPTRLLREEKMRKRISKELPKISSELIRDLEKWENEFGRPFLVHGERYLDLLLEESKAVPGPRSKTPAGPTSANKTTKGGTLTRPNSTINLLQPRAASRAGTKTPAPKSSVRRNGDMSTIKKSPSKIPARAPLSNLKNENSPQRNFMSSLMQEHGRTLMTPLSQAPPPKMRDLHIPPHKLNPINSRAESVTSNGSLRQVTPEDTFFNNTHYGDSQRIQVPPNYRAQAHTCRNEVIPSTGSYSSRQTSSASNTTVSGSENWQTIEDDSEPEEEISDVYYAKTCSTHGKRFIPNEHFSSSQLKKQKAILSTPFILSEDLDAQACNATSNTTTSCKDNDAF